MAKLERSELVRGILDQLLSPVVDPIRVGVTVLDGQVLFILELAPGVLTKSQPMTSPGYNREEMYVVCCEVRDLYHQSKGHPPEPKV
jgi:hypothetical protein